jgi:hypothetical protein
VPLLLLGPPFSPIILFGSTTLLTRMTGISFHTCNGQWLLSHMAVSLEESNCFLLQVKLHALKANDIKLLKIRY